MSYEVLFYILFIAAGSAAGYMIKSLTMSGALASFIVGCSVYLGFGFRGLMILGVFFATSSLWSKYKKRHKSEVEQKVEKGDRRDAIQVFANGSALAFYAIIHHFHPSNWLLFMFLAAIAAANADTWASEIGSLYKKRPILLTTFKRVDPGTSGAVSILGTAAAFAGAAVISVVATVLWSHVVNFKLTIFIVFFGFLGCMIDSVMGALFQVSYVCPRCGLETEKKNHCGGKTKYLKGCKYMNNDVVNACAIFLSSLIGALLLSFFPVYK
jgi:uncharacterized protein (TIGR00297 family)